MVIEMWHNVPSLSPGTQQSRRFRSERHDAKRPEVSSLLVWVTVQVINAAEIRQMAMAKVPPPKREIVLK